MGHRKCFQQERNAVQVARLECLVGQVRQRHGGEGAEILDIDGMLLVGCDAEEDPRRCWGADTTLGLLRDEEGEDLAYQAEQGTGRLKARPFEEIYQPLAETRLRGLQLDWFWTVC